MIVPGVRRPLSSPIRWLIACVAGGVGLAGGWTLTRGATPIAGWFLPVAALASALLFGVELIRTGSRRTLWVVCLCGLVAGRAVYELVRFSTGR